MKFIYRSIRPKWRNPPIPGQLCPPRQRLALASLPLKFQAGVQCGRDKCLLAILSLGAVASHHWLQQKSVSVSAIAACTRIGQSHGTLVGIRADYRSRTYIYFLFLAEKGRSRCWSAGWFVQLVRHFISRRRRVVLAPSVRPLPPLLSSARVLPTRYCYCRNIE